MGRFIWALPTLLAFLLALPFLAGNLERNTAWRQLAACMTSVNASAFWSGAPQPMGDCSTVDEETPFSDIRAIALWANDQRLTDEAFAGLSPTWRQDLFRWRNGGNPSATLASLYIRLSLWNWEQDDWAQSVTLSRLALQFAPQETLADRLIEGIAFRSSERLPYIQDIRRAIADALPTYAYNYTSWFEGMISSRDWDRAEEACTRMRNHLQQPYTEVSAVCPAVLIQGRGDVEGAAKALANVALTLPNDPLVLRWQGLVALRMRDWAAAERFFTQAIRIETRPRYLYGLYIWHGDSLRYLKRNAEARESYEQALHYTNVPANITRVLTLIEQVQ